MYNNNGKSLNANHGLSCIKFLFNSHNYAEVGTFIVSIGTFIVSTDRVPPPLNVEGFPLVSLTSEPSLLTTRLCGLCLNPSPLLGKNPHEFCRSLRHPSI